MKSRTILTTRKNLKIILTSISISAPLSRNQRFKFPPSTSNYRFLQAMFCKFAIPPCRTITRFWKWIMMLPTKLFDPTTSVLPWYLTFYILLISVNFSTILLTFYFFISQRWHPDKKKSEETATSKFQEISEAYQGNCKYVFIYFNEI